MTIASAHTFYFHHKQQFTCFFIDKHTFNVYIIEKIAIIIDNIFK